MKYAYIMPNDFTNGTGVSVSVWMQGCPFHCPGCHNAELWDFNGGQESSFEEFTQKIDIAMKANGIKRNLSILGGEPLCDENIQYTKQIIDWCKENYPDSKIYLWTGYTKENFNELQNKIFDLVDVLIDGPYIEEKRNISLELRGSENQRIFRK